MTTRSTRTLLRGTPALLIGYSILAMVTGLAVAKETRIYKSIAEDGSTVFTDQPAPDATVVKSAPLNVMDALATPPANTTTMTPKNPAEPATASNHLPADRHDCQAACCRERQLDNLHLIGAIMPYAALLWCAVQCAHEMATILNY